MDIHSPEALLAALQWTVLGVRDRGAGEYETQLYYAGPNDFQSMTAKHAVVMDFGVDGSMDAYFASYNED